MAAPRGFNTLRPSPDLALAPLHRGALVQTRHRSYGNRSLRGPEDVRHAVGLVAIR